MRLFIQIPCLNEETTLPLVLASIPPRFQGSTRSRSSSSTTAPPTARSRWRARSASSTSCFHTRNMGLARSFRDGVDYALQHGADIVVNTDGDNQYPQERIADLVAADPRAARPTSSSATGRPRPSSTSRAFKKLMQRVGSSVVNFAAQTDLPDAASGFRAYSRESLIRLNIVTQFSYCMETIIQAGNKRLRIASIPIDDQPQDARVAAVQEHLPAHGPVRVRPSCAATSCSGRTWCSSSLAVLFFIGAAIPFVRFLILTWMGVAGDHIQSLVFGSAMLVGALLCIALLVISDMLHTNRTLVEDSLERLKRLEYSPDRIMQTTAQDAGIESWRAAPAAAPAPVPANPAVAQDDAALRDRRVTGASTR